MIPAAILGEMGLGIGASILTDAAGQMRQLITPEYDAQKEWFRQQDISFQPVGLPPADGLLAAYLKGYFELDDLNKPIDGGWETFRFLARANGMAIGVKGDRPFGGGPSLDNHKKGWWSILRSMLVRPGIKEGFQGFIAGAYDRDKLKYILKRNGALIDDWFWLLPLLCQRLSIDQVSEVWRRGLIKDQDFESYAKQLQFGMPADVGYLKQLSNIIPGPQDLVRFVIRDAFAPDLVKAFELDAELDKNPLYKDFCYAQGLGPVTITNRDNKQVSADFADLYWYAHWVQPSPGQAAEFLHRLYSNSRWGPSPWLNFARKFEIDDFNKLMRASDYSPAWRDRLQAISFNPLPQRYLKKLMGYQLIEEKDAYHNYRAIGFTDSDADRMAKLLVRDADPLTNGHYTDEYKRKYCKAYSVGFMDVGEYSDALMGMGLTLPQAKAEVGLCDLDKQIQITTDGVRAVKAGFMSGAYSYGEVQTLLIRLEITPERITQYLFNWQIQLDARRRVVAASEVSRWFIDGLIGEQELISRLTKLQYSAEDVTRIAQAAVLNRAKALLTAEKKANAEIARQIEKNLQQAEKQRRLLEQRQREQERQIKQAIKDQQRLANERLVKFLSARTEKHLIQWWKEGTIGEDEIRMTLALKGWDPKDIDRWVESNRPR